MQRRFAVLVSTLALAATGLVLGGTPPASAATTLTLSTVNAPTYTHSASSCSAGSDNVTTAYRTTQFTPVASGDVNVLVNPTTAGFTPEFALYTAAFDPTNPSATCLDVSGSNTVTTFQATAGTAYEVVVTSAVAGQEGGYTLSFGGGAVTGVRSTADAPQVTVGARSTSTTMQTVPLTATSAADIQGLAPATWTMTLRNLTHPEYGGSQATFTAGDQSGGYSSGLQTMSITGTSTDQLSVDVHATNALGVGASFRLGAPAVPVITGVAPGQDGVSVAVSWDLAAADPSVLFVYGTAYAVSTGTGAPPAPVLQSFGLVSPGVITGLTEGTAYTLILNAQNRLNQATSAAVAFTTRSRPGAPAIGAGTPTAAGYPITIGTAPGETATSYTVTATAPGVAPTVASSATAGVVVLAGLRPSTSYVVTATAANAVGAGPASAPLTITTPPAPVLGTVTGVVPEPHGVTVFFTGATGPVQLVAVPGNGGAPVSVTGTSSPLHLTGLTDGVGYTVYVLNAGAVVPTAGGTSVRSGARPAVKLSVPTTRVKAGAKVTLTGSVTAAGAAQKGLTVVLTRKVKGHTTTVGTHATDAKGHVTFRVTSARGTTYQLTLRIGTYRTTSKAGSIRFR